MVNVVLAEPNNNNKKLACSKFVIFFFVEDIETIFITRSVFVLHKVRSKNAIKVFSGLFCFFLNLNK